MAENRGVILFNLGGPETLKDVRPSSITFGDRHHPDQGAEDPGLTIAVTRQRKSRDSTGRSAGIAAAADY
jgi:protoheme ferro-lyase